MKRIPMTSLRQTWKTPKAVYQTLDAEFGFDFDPCPPNPGFDGLNREWGKRNFINPPFKGIEKWVAKAYAEHLLGKICVMLIPSRTDTRYWHDFCMKASEIRFIKGRLKFDDCKSPAPFPSAVIIFNPASLRATDGFEVE